MTTISIRNNFPQVAAQLDSLAADVGNKAMVRALNTTIVQGRKLMARQISSEFRLGVGTVDARLRVDRASARGGAYTFTATLKASKGKGRSMNLIAFAAKGRVSKASAKRTGRADMAGQLQFQIKRGGGRKVIKGAFIGNGGRTVFLRVPGSTMASRSKYAGTKHAEEIVSLSTIDIPQMFNTRRVNKVIKQVMLDKFPDNFKRELRAVLGGYVK